ncbi:transcription factor MafG-like [Stylophora pistillata]|uniref:transcription factor MafG-like n=1 Tax=Stylophora pistillata TaxID=50429 RepID=UPI000C0452D7|nr:transcription factor MafG-like [Stylophora pistillata]
MRSVDRKFLMEKMDSYLDSFGGGEFTLNNTHDRLTVSDGVCYTRVVEGLPIAPERPTESANLHQQSNHNRSLSFKVIKKLLDDEYLETTSIQELNRKLRRLPEGLMQKFRKRRRVLKNRKYALKCRRKGMQRQSYIAEENAALEREILRANMELKKVSQERDKYRQKYERFVDAVKTSSELPMAEYDRIVM